MNKKKAIIVLAVIIVPLFVLMILAQKPIDHSDRDKHVTEAEIKILGKVISVYVEDTGKLPEEGQGFSELVRRSFGNAESALVDAWGKPYKFSVFEESNSYLIWSPGSESSEYGLLMYYFSKVNGTYQSTKLVGE